MSMTLIKPARWLAAAALIPCLLSAPATAQTSYDLRSLSFNIGWSIVDNQQTNPSARFLDKFSNGDPLTGGQYINAITPATIYGVRNSGFSAGSEAAVNDFFGQNYAVGRLRFSAADAIANPSNLDAPGTTTMVNRITLRDPDAGAFATSAQTLSADAAFMFATPDVNSWYGLRLSEAAGAGIPFNDQIDLRITQNGAGVPLLNLRRLSSLADGTTLVNTGFGSVSVASFLYAGKTLADVALVQFELSFAGGSNGLRADAELVDALGNRIGYYDYFDATGGATFPLIFHGETFTHVSAGANWTVTSVPEPGTYALMLGGFAVLGLAVRRRRA